MGNLFCDLDGVLADFDAHADALFGVERRGWPPGQFWKAVSKHGEFFSTMPWMPSGRRLWARFSGATILTALPRTDMEKVERQKREWCARELGPHVPVICVPPSRDKSEWCSPGAVLIDDRERNCAKWKAAGGFAILYVTAKGGGE